MSGKPAINVYCIRDPVTSKEKFAHRNFLQPVSFLHAGDNDVCELSSSVAGSEQYDPLVSVEVQDGETKTINWLLRMGDSNDVDATASEPGSSPAVTAPASEAEVGVVPQLCLMF